jgi:polar amino acid transport system substrate-binding protein
MKKGMVATLAIALVAVPVASVGAAPNGESLPTQKPDTLVVGLSLPSPQFQTGTPRGTEVRNPKGMEIDMAREIAKALGLSKVEFYNYADFTKVYAPGTKPVDFTLAEVTITAARKKAVDFSTQYMKANQGVMIRKGLTPVPKSINDLKDIVLCAQRGTTGADYIRLKVRPNKPALYPANTTIQYQQLRNGQCDAALYDAPLIGAERAQRPTRYGPIIGQIVTNELYGAVFEKGSPLRPKVDAVIKKLLANGTIGKLAKKWLTADVSKLPILR